MKKIIIILLTILFTSFIFIYSNKYIDNKVIKISDKFYVVFKGIENNEIYTTYVYVKKSKGRNKYSYTNTAIIVNNYEDTYSDEIITKSGNSNNWKQLFKIAKKNKAYDYVITKDSYIYSIDEYKEIIKGDK